MNHGKTITIYQIAELLGKAYPLAFIPNNITSGFRSTGIWPLNRQIFSDDDFLASAVTDRPPPVQQITNEADEIPVQVTIGTAELEAEFNETPETPQQVQDKQTEKTPSVVSFQLPSCSTSSEMPSTSVKESSLVLPQQVRPYPRAEARKENK